jgi:competence protein ComEA
MRLATAKGEITMTHLIKAFIAGTLALLSAVAFAAVDVNKGSQAELESVKSIGPVLATRILDERKKAPFKDWNDMVVRVKGIGPGNAAKFSTQGLTVNGTAFQGAAPVAVARKDDKAVTKPTTGKGAETKATK